MADTESREELTVEHSKRTLVANAFERIQLLFHVLVRFSSPEESAVKSGIQWLELRGEKETLAKAKVGEFRILYFVFILFSLFEPRITEKTSALKLKIDIESCSDTSVPSQYHSIVKIRISRRNKFSNGSFFVRFANNCVLKQNKPFFMTLR